MVLPCVRLVESRINMYNRDNRFPGIRPLGRKVWALSIHAREKLAEKTLGKVDREKKT